MSHCHLLDVLKTVNNIQTRLDQVLLLNIGTKIPYGAGHFTAFTLLLATQQLKHMDHGFVWVQSLAHSRRVRC